MTDFDLLERYRAEGAADAFAALVQQHLNLVYSVARRQVESAAAAEDVTQAVFIELAQQAARIKTGTPLVAWLHLVSRRIAINAARADGRRRTREAAAVELATMNSPSPDWTVISPLLDEAVGSLAPVDRAAILMRFFENKSLRDVGAAVGLSEDAAQKRVSRALEQLRTFFLRRGVTLSGAGLVEHLAANAVQAASAPFAATIATTALSKVVARVTMSKAVASTVVQKSIAAAVTLGAIVGVVYQSSALISQRRALAEVAARVEALTGQLDREQKSGALLARELDETLQQQRARLAATPTSFDPTAAAEMKGWLMRASRLKELAKRPGKSIPETALLTEKDWMTSAQDVDLDHETGNPRQVEDALRGLRGLAKLRFATHMMDASLAYVNAHAGLLPKDARELAPYFVDNVFFKGAAVTAEMLDRYVVRYPGQLLSEVPKKDQGAIFYEITSPDEERDQRVYSGPAGTRITDFQDFANETDFARRAYVKANGDSKSPSAYELLPYFKPALSPARQNKFIQMSGSSELP